jgi:hypothetical protein
MFEKSEHTNRQVETTKLLCTQYTLLITFLPLVLACLDLSTVTPRVNF